MTATLEADGRRTAAGAWQTWAPTIFIALNALVFYRLRPGVPDLWAARARAFAAGHGVSPGYWFGWFGGSTPGNYSVISPYLCNAVGTELAAGLAAVAVAAAATVLVRGTRRPVAAAWTAAFGAGLNLWCGRVPFLLGAAFALGALACVARRRALPAAVLAVVSVLASPVSGVFLGLGLSGVLFAHRARHLRATVLVTLACAGAALLTIELLFGAPGPEPLPLYLIGEVVLVLGLLQLAGPPAHLRLTLAVSAVAAVVVFSIPNGMGANIARLALFCLPPAAVATGRQRARVVAAVMAPVLLLGVASSASALLSSVRPGSSAGYYAPLATELDTLHATAHRLEVVDAGHAAYAVLLGHAELARGWETQEDLARDPVLHTASLDSGSYRAWLDDNAVGYVAIVLHGSSSPEARVVAGRPGYLHEIWRSSRWRLYAVRSATPIVGAPAALVSANQSSMTVHVPCACTVTVRVRWSRFLGVTVAVPPGTPDAVEDSYDPDLTADAEGWTTLRATRAGTYVLAASL